MNKGQAMVEYVFLLALVVIVVIISISLFGDTLLELYQDILTRI
jgi:Flp pilus assembly pilin Flp